MSTKEQTNEKPRKEKKELTPAQIQQRKKMLVYPLMGIAFVACMWLIFAPSGKKKETEIIGFNTDLPTPKESGIISDKKDAYQQEAMKEKQKQKMRSLESYAFSIGENEGEQITENNRSISLSETSYTGKASNSSAPDNSITSSAHAYKQVNRQLNSFYESPSRPDEKEIKLQERIEELERTLEEKESHQRAIDEEFELMERSYQLATKYMPQTPIEQEVPSSSSTTNNQGRKPTAEPISQVQNNVVSLLSGEIDNKEFMAMYSEPRNLGFLTAAGQENEVAGNSIRASVYQEITLSEGKELQLRLQEAMRVGNIIIPAGTILTGTAKISGERLDITITSVQHNGSIIPVELTVYDLDGLRGISAPGSDELNAAKEIAAGMGTSMGSSITITDNAGSQLAADLGRSVIQGASQYVSKKMRMVKVNLKAGYKVLLLPVN